MSVWLKLTCGCLLEREKQFLLKSLDKVVFFCLFQIDKNMLKNMLTKEYKTA